MDVTNIDQAGWMNREDIVRACTDKAIQMLDDAKLPSHDGWVIGVSVAAAIATIKQRGLFNELGLEQIRLHEQGYRDRLPSKLS